MALREEMVVVAVFQLISISKSQLYSILSILCDYLISKLSNKDLSKQDQQQYFSLFLSGYSKINPFSSLPCGRFGFHYQMIAKQLFPKEPVSSSFLVKGLNNNMYLSIPLLCLYTISIIQFIQTRKYYYQTVAYMAVHKLSLSVYIGVCIGRFTLTQILPQLLGLLSSFLV